MTRGLDQVAAEVRTTVAARSSRQAGVFRRRDLLEWGVDDAMLQAMFRRGLWVRLRHGVYADAQALTDADPLAVHRMHVAAAIAAADEPAFAVGPSAAVLHGLPLPYRVPDAVHVVRESRQDLRSLSRPSRHRLQIPPMALTAHAIGPDEATMVDGVPSVTSQLAAITTAPSVGFFRKVGLFDAVMWQGRVSAAELAAAVDGWPRLGQRSAVLDAVARARPGAQTYLETYSRLVLMGQGIPEPLLQVAFHDAEGLIGFVDMWWPGLRVVGEADGAVKYESRQVLIDEKRREDRLRALGLPVVRWMISDIAERPQHVAEAIRRAARRAA
jgi:hypothetical protein